MIYLFPPRTFLCYPYLVIENSLTDSLTSGVLLERTCQGSRALFQGFPTHLPIFFCRGTDANVYDGARLPQNPWYLPCVCQKSRKNDFLIYLNNLIFSGLINFERRKKEMDPCRNDGQVRWKHMGESSDSSFQENVRFRGPRD